jgi:hypothetical protein
LPRAMLVKGTAVGETRPTVCEGKGQRAEKRLESAKEEVTRYGAKSREEPTCLWLLTTASSSCVVL